MCTMIVTQVNIEGSGKGANGWFQLREANVSYDHPFDAPLEHALNIDFVNEALGPGARVAVELSVEAARALSITLTKRGQHMGEDIPMCGVPVHAADDYLQKLIARGQTMSVQLRFDFGVECA